MRTGELERIALLRAHLAVEAPGVRIGIGDDAAVLASPPGAGELVWTIDAQVEGTHFRRAWVSWRDVGYRSYMAAASDLAAMGAEPVAALSALALPAAFTDEELAALADGQAEAAREVGAPVAGGNLARASELSVTTTLLGRAARPVLRSGARAGEGVFLAGAVGLAAAGLAALSKNVHDACFDPCLAAWRRPRARIEDGRTIAGLASAAIDVSDGLALDASHLAEASGVRLVLDEALLRAHVGGPLEAAASALGRDPVDLALHGGEDYALVATSAAASLPGFTRIGVVEAHGSEQSRVALATPAGVRDLAPRGFDHFAP